MKKQLLAVAFVFGALGCAVAAANSQPTRSAEAQLGLVLQCQVPVVAGPRAVARPRACDILYWTNLRLPHPTDRTRPVPPGGRGLLPMPVPVPYWLRMLVEVA